MTKWFIYSKQTCLMSSTRYYNVLGCKLL